MTAEGAMIIPMTELDADGVPLVGRHLWEARAAKKRRSRLLHEWASGDSVPKRVRPTCKTWGRLPATPGSAARGRRSLDVEIKRREAETRKYREWQRRQSGAGGGR